MLSMREQLENLQNEQEIKKMLEAQKARLEEISTPKKKGWDESILVNGGVSSYTFTDSVGTKRKVRISVPTEDNKTSYKFHFRKADGVRVTINCKTYKDAQEVVDSLFGKGHYKVSASTF